MATMAGSAYCHSRRPTGFCPSSSVACMLSILLCKDSCFFSNGQMFLSLIAAAASPPAQKLSIHAFISRSSSTW